MKKMFLIALPLVLIAATLSAQPQVSYIIPDVGTPGMNTYVEIIAPIGAQGAFGPESMSAPGAVTVEFVNPADTTFIVVSPVVVGWEGRLISCQFFVKPYAPVRPYPFRVRVNNDRSNVDTFFVETPQAFGSKNGGGVIGSGGGWGRRSKRGAMIVDSIVLGPGFYTIDTQTDPDPAKAGHQGFLPAVILSNGPVRIDAAAVLSASGSGKDGGPGGGGGGGYGSGVPPVIPGERNMPLGSGFTGGKSNIPIISSPPSSFGQGSGVSSRALNGAEANSNFTTTFPSLARLYGAGPGHPFDDDGRSGGGAAATGGSGFSAFGTYFGGGGNGTKGSGLPTAQDDMNGQIVGNRQIVPLHGGGGGSSGGTSDSVGAGGGGGVAIYSQLGAVFSGVQANGADGANGCNACGPGSGDASGGGAGGSIIVGGKLGLQLGTMEVRGGRAGTTQPSAPVASTSGSGGVGRFRHDGRINGGAPSVTTGASRSAGPTIDTLTVVTKQIFTVKGTGSYSSGRGANIQVFVRGESLQWNYTSPYNAVVQPDSTWQAEVAITTTDPLLYIFAVQLTDANERDGTDEWTRVPTHVFSQAAANIVRYYPAPEIQVPTDVWIDTLLCPDGTAKGRIPVFNSGAALLVIDNLTYFTGATGLYFDFSPPTRFPMSIEPGTWDTIHVVFSGANLPRGEVVGELEIYTNVSDLAGNTRRMRVHAFNAFRSYLDPNPERPITVDFGDVRVGSSMDRRAVIRNITNVVSTDIRIDSLWVSPPTVSIVTIARSIPKGTPVRPGDSLVMQIRYSPTMEETLGPVFLCARIAEPCLDTICWPLTGKGIRSSIALSKPSLSMAVPACSARVEIDDTVAIINNGSTTIEVLSISATPSGMFSVLRPTVPPSMSLPPGTDREIIVRYTPGTATRETGTLSIATSDPDLPDLTVNLNGAWDTAAVEPSTHSVGLFGSTPGVQVDSIVRIRNTGTVECTVHVQQSGGTGTFSISPPAPYVIAAGGEVAVTFSYTPTIPGTVAATMYITSEPCGLIDSLSVEGGLADCRFILEPQPLDFSGVRVGATSQRVAVVTNLSSQDGLRVVGARIVPPTSELAIAPTQVFPILIPAGGMGAVALNYTPGALGSLPPGTRLEVDIDSPCDSTATTEVTGQGVEGTLLAVPDPLDFGEVYSCVTRTDTIRLQNVSAAAVTILGLQVDPNPGEFTAALADPSRPTPLMNPDDVIEIVVTFDPSAPPDGPKNATLKILTNDPDIGTFEVPLLGRRLSESLTLTGPAFAPTLAGGRDVRRMFIVNNGTTTIPITNLTVPPPFRIIGTTPPFNGHFLPPGDTLFVDLEFGPTREGRFEDSIEVEGLTICGSLYLPVSGESPPAFTADAYWDGITGKPGEIILLPLMLTTDVTGAGITQYDIDVRFNASMLFPRRIVLNGTLSDNWVVTGERLDTGSVVFKATGSDPLEGSGTLVFVEMLVLLGNDLTTTIESTDSSRFLTGGARLAIAPGLFSLNGYCTVGGNRLVRVMNNFGIKLVSPNPARDRILIDFELVEDGPTRLALYDMLGRQVAVLMDADMTAQPYQLETPLALPEGTYFLELTTPTQRVQKGIVVGR